MTNHSMIIPVILCGGSGTRLWPLSRRSFPKQFVPLIGGKSLLQLTLERVAGLSRQVVCVAAEEHRFLVGDALQAANTQGCVLLEPAARNTAAAMTLAALHAQQQGQVEALLLFCPSDHHIPDTEGFISAVRGAEAAAKHGAIVTFGITPSFPSAAYGYIRQGPIRPDGSHSVECFIEKPTVDKAQTLILAGDVLWNAGIFLCSAQVLLQALEHHAPDILAVCQQAMAQASKDGAFVRPQATAFVACRAESVDFAVMEPLSFHGHREDGRASSHSEDAQRARQFANAGSPRPREDSHDGTPGIVVFPYAGAWSDVGSWNAVAELAEPDAQGNRINGQGLAVQAHRTYIHAPHRPVVALGTQDLLIIDTPDALLVADRAHTEQVKQVVAELEARDTPQAALHRKVARPWGWYDSIDLGERFQVKRIVVKPGASLSLQKHHHRAEHWVVVKGTAEVTRGKDIFLLTENQSTYIPIGEVHRLKNPGETDLEMIEVQSGSYLGEDDIVRLEDTYGRA